MPRSTVAPEIKAKAIADLLTGDQPAVVAARYGIAGSTIRQWKRRMVTSHVTRPVTAHVIRQPAIEAQQLELGELVMLNLRAKLIATQRIAENATSTEWL